MRRSCGPRCTTNAFGYYAKGFVPLCKAEGCDSHLKVALTVSPLQADSLVLTQHGPGAVAASAAGPERAGTVCDCFGARAEVRLKWGKGAVPLAAFLSPKHPWIAAATMQALGGLVELTGFFQSLLSIVEPFSSSRVSPSGSSLLLAKPKGGFCASIRVA